MPRWMIWGIIILILLIAPVTATHLVVTLFNAIITVIHSLHLH